MQLDPAQALRKDQSAATGARRRSAQRQLRAALRTALYNQAHIRGNDSRESGRTKHEDDSRESGRNIPVTHGTVCLDIYEGSGGIGRAFRGIGHPTVGIDVRRGDWCDLTRPVVLRTIIGWIKSGLVHAVWLATPCSSNSRARRAPPWSSFPHRLRSERWPLGLPKLSAADKAVVTLGNKLADASNQIAKNGICTLRARGGRKSKLIVPLEFSLPSCLCRQAGSNTTGVQHVRIRCQVQEEYSPAALAHEHRPFRDAMHRKEMQVHRM